MFDKNKKEKEHELALMMLQHLSYIIKCVNFATYYGSKTSMIASYLIEYIMPHYDEELCGIELCDFEPFEINEIINSFKDAEIQLKMMQSKVNNINEAMSDFSDSIDDLMAHMGIYAEKRKQDGIQLDYEKLLH